VLAAQQKISEAERAVRSPVVVDPCGPAGGLQQFFGEVARQYAGQLLTNGAAR
jgi:hypothetical protein